MGSIRCVCFDWGGVILAHCRSWHEACTHAKIPLRAGFDRPDLVLRRRQINHDFTLGLLDEGTFFALLAGATDGLYSVEEVRRVHHAWLTHEYEGVGEVIDRLHAGGLETGLLSNTNAAHWSRHQHQGGGKADFPTIGKLRHKHASHLLGFAKPGEEIYREFERKTGFAPAEILFFDDLSENVMTARRLGWHAEAIDHTRATAPQILAHLERHRCLAGCGDGDHRERERPPGADAR